MLFDLLRLASLGQNMELYASLQIRQPQNQDAQANGARRSSDFPPTGGPSQHPYQDFRHHGPRAEPRQQSQTQDTPPPPQPPQQQQTAHEQFKNHRHQRSGGGPASSAGSCHDHPKQQQAQCKPLDLSVKSVGPTHYRTVIKRQDLMGEELPPLGGCHKRRRPRPAPILLVPVSSRQRHRREERSCKLKVSRSKAKFDHLKLISSASSPSSCSHSGSSPSSFEEETSGGPKSAQAISSTNERPQARRLKQKGLKSHLCHQCGRSFSRSDMLTRHSRLHSGHKPYQCSKCKQVFSRSDHLSTHERTHTGEKPYQCQYCAYSACRRDMITRHMRTHSGNLAKGPKWSSATSCSSPNEDTDPHKIGQLQSAEMLTPRGLLTDCKQHHDDISTSSLDDNDEAEATDDDEEADVTGNRVPSQNG